MKISQINPTLVLFVVAAAAGVVLAKKIAKGAEKAAAAVDPTNPDNVANSAVTAVGREISGDSAWTLGGWVYDVTHSDEDFSKTPTKKEIEDKQKDEAGLFGWGFLGL